MNALPIPHVCEVIPLPSVPHFRAALTAVRERAKQVGADGHTRRRAEAIVLREMQAGRSAAAAIALANSSMRAGYVASGFDPRPAA